MCDRGVSRVDSRGHSERQACHQAVPNLLAFISDTHKPQTAIGTRLEPLVAHQLSDAPSLITALIRSLLTAGELKRFTVL